MIKLNHSTFNFNDDDVFFNGFCEPYNYLTYVLVPFTMRTLAAIG